MIKTKKDLRDYLRQDREKENLNKGGLKTRIKILLNPRLRFLMNLRYYEYYANQPRTLYRKFMTLYFYLIHKRLSYKLGYTIYKNNFGPGLFLAHYGTIVVNKNARIGKNCRCHVGVNIGGYNGGVLIGNVMVGNNVMIGAGAVVTKDVPDNAVVVGVPAKIVSYEGSRHVAYYS